MSPKRFAIRWGAPSARERGPVVAGPGAGELRNAIGVHGGAFGVYRALAIGSGQLDPAHRADLSGTEPSVEIGPFPQWFDPRKIVTFDPWGARVAELFAAERARGIDIRPSIAIASGRIRVPEICEALRRGRLRADDVVLSADGDVHVTKIAIEPVWYLPGVAERLGVDERRLRHALLEHMHGMYPEVVSDSRREILLPPIGGTSVYLFGDAARLGDPSARITCRVHDECNGSDVFGSDLCTCRPYLTFGIEACVRAAQAGEIGVVCYNRKEGRALGEVVKLLVYNARRRAASGDRAEHYFQRTEQVVGARDLRLQELMPDVLHWLGIRRIDRWLSMSNLKYEALVKQGIEIVERIALPDSDIPAHANVEISAKKAAGYFCETADPRSASGSVAAQGAGAERKASGS